MNVKGGWNIELECKPELQKNLERIYAWYEQEVVDRPPIRFVSNNQCFRDSLTDENIGPGKRWETYTERWYDVEYRVAAFEESLKGKELLGENMPIFWPDFSPNFLAGTYGCDVQFDHTSGWVTSPIIDGYDQIENQLVFQEEGKLYQTAIKLVEHALTRSEGKYLVGFPDHNILSDCMEAIRGTVPYLLDLSIHEEDVKKAHDIITKDFNRSYDRFDSMLKAGKSMSCNWMGIPSFGRFYVPTADISCMFSTAMYENYYFDTMDKVISSMDHTVYHMDGKGVANHLDVLLEHKDLNGIQWVQGMGADRPILQWVPMIHRVQKGGKSIICDVDLCDLEAFIDAVPDRRGIFLFVESHDIEEQQAILRRIEKW